MGGYFVTQYDYDRGNRMMRILLSEMLLVQQVLSGDFYLFSYVVSELAIYKYEIGYIVTVLENLSFNLK